MTRRRGRGAALGTLVVVAVAVALFVASGRGASVDPGSAGTATSGAAAPTAGASGAPPAPASVDAAAARTLLGGLAVRPWATGARYDRTADFGDAWIDVDRNGCDTRNDVLARDLSGVRRSSTCKVLSGLLTSPYSGARISFVKGPRTSELVQIDHVVALSDAWRTGAQNLSPEQRVAFANDPLELLAVDGASNDDKGSQDASAWLPANAGYRCAYVTRQIRVKAKYRLWVTPSERGALLRVLSGCP